MKKIVASALLISIIVSLFSGICSATEIQASQNKSPTRSTADFTHTVFAEYASTTTCGYCPLTSAALYAISQSGDYPFYYVSLVSNKNNASKSRLIHYRTIAVPTVYGDGGFLNRTGAESEGVYRSMIEDCGERTVHSLQMELSAVTQGDAKIKITITIKNNGSFFYLGGLFTYITEITSRWNDASRKPYHYACIDIPMKRPLILLPKGSRTFTVTWDGASVGFGDINYDNIKIISTVSHWLPHKHIGYGDNKYYAFYVDQAMGSSVSSR